MKELAYLFEEVTTVEVTFQDMRNENSKSCTYKCLKSEALQPGDCVIVLVANQGLKLVTVIEMHSTPKIVDGIDYEWIVQKVDLTHYNELIEHDKKVMDFIYEHRYAEQCRQARDEFITSLPIDGLKALGVDVDD